MRKLCARVVPVVRHLSFLPPLWVRLVMGWVFLSSGWFKLHNLASIVDFFSSLGIPAPGLQAPFVATVETVGGVCLLLGLATRLVSVPLAFTMVVALLTAKREDAFKDLGSLLETAEFLYLTLLVALTGLGGGKLSLDHWLGRRCGKPATFHRPAAHGQEF